jgi:HD-like signal output (HDOD) protein
MLAANSPGAYADILALANKRDAPLWQTETEVLGYSHAEVGGCLLGLWGLDLTIVEAVSRHHHQDLALSEELSTAKLVFDANLQVCTGGTTPGNRK